MVPGGRDHGDLRIAVAVLFAQAQREIPLGLGGLEQGLGAVVLIDALRWRVEPLVLVTGLVVGRATVVSHHPEHLPAIVRKAREGTVVLGQLRRHRVGGRGHQRGDATADGDGLVGVVGHPAHHEVGAQVGVAQTQGPVLVAQLRDVLARELRHQDRHLEGDRPQPARVADGVDVELARLGTVLDDVLHEVDRREVAGRVVQEHVLRARVARVDATVGRARVPVVDGRVELQPGVGAGPTRCSRPCPKARAHAPCGRPCRRCDDADPRCRRPRPPAGSRRSSAPSCSSFGPRRCRRPPSPSWCRRCRTRSPAHPGAPAGSRAGCSSRAPGPDGHRGRTF